MMIMEMMLILSRCWYGDEENYDDVRCQTSDEGEDCDNEDMRVVMVV